jgi:Terminase RNaseH-like domain
VLGDYSGRYTPTQWAERAIALYREHKADRIVAEVKNGGEMVENTLRMVDDGVAFTAVHASRGKVIRAEPVAALYEQRPGRRTGSTRWCGPSPICSSSGCPTKASLNCLANEPPRRPPKRQSASGSRNHRRSRDRWSGSR